jgi:tRNA G18 (ribose-2'-O)-methylase SpoU
MQTISERAAENRYLGSTICFGLDVIEDPRAWVRSFELQRVCRRAWCFCSERATGLTDVVAKVAAGVLEYVPVARVTNLVRLIEQLKERNIWVVAQLETPNSCTQNGLKQPSAIMVGNEGQGLHRLVRETRDTLVRICCRPSPVVECAVAAGVLMYEAL